MVLIPYAGKYFGRKCAYWGEWGLFLCVSFVLKEEGGPRGEGKGVIGLGWC